MSAEVRPAYARGGMLGEPGISLCAFLWPVGRLERAIADEVTTLERGQVERIAAAVRDHYKTKGQG